MNRYATRETTIWALILVAIALANRLIGGVGVIVIGAGAFILLRWGIGRGETRITDNDDRPETKR